MKKLFLMMACLLSATATQAQSLYLHGNLPARDGSGNWYQMAYQYVNTSGSNETRDFAGKTYYTIRCYTKLVYPEWYVNYLSMPNGKPGPGTTLYMRQEEGKTYLYNEKAEKEEVVMDINLEKGDEFVRPDGEKMWVENVTDEDGVKVLYLKGSKSDDIWRSDIGSAHYGILPSADIIPGLTLECITYDCACQYVADLNEELIKTTTVSFKEAADQTSLWPYFGALKYVFEDDALHVTGRVSTWNRQDHVVECLVDNDNNVFLAFRSTNDYASLEMGISEIDVKFTGFKAGDYLVCGQAMEPVSLECKGLNNDATGISSVDEVQAKEASEIYDLTGRRLDHEPAQGLYIKDGRKVLKR